MQIIYKSRSQVSIERMFVSDINTSNAVYFVLVIIGHVRECHAAGEAGCIPNFSSATSTLRSAHCGTDESITTGQASRSDTDKNCEYCLR